MSLERRFFDLGKRVSRLFNRAQATANMRERHRIAKSGMKLQRKKFAARDKAERRGEAWVGDYYSKPN